MRKVYISSNAEEPLVPKYTPGSRKNLEKNVAKELNILTDGTDCVG